MNKASDLILRCTESTREIVALLEQPDVTLDVVLEKMNIREQIINDLTFLADNSKVEPVVSDRQKFDVLMSEDKKMRTLIASLLEKTGDALRMVDHEEKAGRTYVGSHETNAFITGRLEG